jgi:hypothetical protein
MFEVKVTGPSIVPAIPEAASESRGKVFLRLGGVESRLRKLARVLGVVLVEQLEAQGNATDEGARTFGATGASSLGYPGG